MGMSLVVGDDVCGPPVKREPPPEPPAARQTPQPALAGGKHKVKEPYFVPSAPSL